MQSRKVGVYIPLRDLAEKVRLDPFNLEMIEEIAEALKQEFIKGMGDFIEGQRVSVVRRLSDAEVVSRVEFSPTQNGSFQTASSSGGSGG
jgi:hypothetical protein